jgi:hypothetical protein
MNLDKIVIIQQPTKLHSYSKNKIPSNRKAMIEQTNTVERILNQTFFGVHTPQTRNYRPNDPMNI